MHMSFNMRIFFGLKAYKLKFVTYAQTDTGTVNIIAESGSCSIKSDTQRWTEIQRELEREPEIILDTDTTCCTDETPVETKIGLESTTDTHVPVPFTLLFPRNRSVERINPVVRTSGFEACKKRNTDFQLNHVRFTQSVLVTEFSSVAQTSTDCTRLCISHHAGYSENGYKKNFFHLNFQSKFLFIILF